MCIRIFCALWVSLTLLPVSAQLQIGAELRPRVLADMGYSTPKTSDSQALAFITQRTRLNTRFKADLFETCISIQDVRFWGGDNNFKSSGAYGSTGTISLHQGWFLLNARPWLSLKVGRQLLSYDDQRILSSRGWNDYQVTYDALLVRAEYAGHRVDLGLSWNAESNSKSYFSEQKFKTIDFLRYELERELFSWSAIGLVTGNTVSDTVDQLRYRITWGTNFTLQTSRIQARASAYYQHHMNDTWGRVSAWAGSLHAGTVLVPGRLKWNIGVDFVSGQDDIADTGYYPEVQHSFDLLYGRRHTWYGYMDYFSNMPPQGLQDYVLQLEYTPGGKLTLQADYHFFWLAAHMADPLSQLDPMEKRLGDELDLTVIWKISNTATLQAGYSFFLTQATLEAVKGVSGQDLRFPQFGYLMITLKPGFTFQP